MIILTKNNHQEVIASPKPVVIDVYATWCGPCMEMKPIFEDLEKTHGDKYLFASLNVDEARELAIQYGVSSVPTFIFMKDGNVAGKRTGYMSAEDLIETIQQHLG